MTADDDDLPSKREAIPDPGEVMNRVARGLGRDFFTAFSDACSGDRRKQIRGQLAMVVLTINAGEMPGRDFAPLPPHLPDAEREMRQLAVSSAAADMPLRADLYAWSRHNREHADAATKALENAVMAYQDGVELEDADEAVQGHCEIIASHVHRVWGADVRLSPNDDRLAGWARAIVDHKNPTPTWLVDNKRARLFVPGTVDTKHGQARNPLASFRAYRDDDD